MISGFGMQISSYWSIEERGNDFTTTDWKCVSEQHVTESWEQFDYPDDNWPQSIETDRIDDNEYIQGRWIIPR